ncbi:MAG: TRAP transporter substrate-binding protein [Sedimentisphaerales bacterium]|nr:TRAP transporter substrate-binding protein [Sedimentisphaerales bacterium]
MKKLFKIAICIFVFTLTSPLFAQEEALLQEPIELKISHFGSPTWIQQTEVLEVWARKIESLTDGRVKFSFFPQQALGTASEQYDLVVNGTADISLGLTTYTPGRFPLTSCMKLPFMGQDGEEASIVLWRLYQKHLKNEFQDTKVLWMFCLGPGHLHNTKKQVKTIEDMKGLKFRVADSFIAKALKLLGANPVVCSVSEGYDLIKEGKIDGTILPWEGALDFGYLDSCKYHTEIGFYTLPLFVVMNKEKYESLPSDIRKIIDENIGEEMSALAGRAMNDEDVRGKKVAEDRGDSIYYLPESELKRWKQMTMPLGDEWIKEMESRGLPGQKVLSHAIELRSEIYAVFQNKESLEPIELKISHFGTADWPYQKKVLEPWANKIEKLTNGRVKFSFFPNQIMGTAPEQYNLVVNGTADIAVGITNYTPDRFPLTSCMQLPFLGESGETASIVLWHLYQKYLKDEFKETKVLGLWCHGPGHLHTTKKPIKTLEDLKGLRIKVANPTLEKALKLLGAVPVICTINDASKLFNEGGLDGVALPWEGVSTFNLSDLCKYHTETSIYTLSFFAVMNKEKYESLPADIRKIIDENIGESISALAGKTSDEEDVKARNIAKNKGNFIYTLPKHELQRWKKITMPVGDQWVEEMQVKDLPGQEVLSFVVDLFMQLQE